MASPSPKSPEQTEKTKQYDRQLRLWGDHGQAALERGHVCLINATALGTEILKSVVLPGVGAVTIVDDKKVIEEDIGSNFFLEPTSLGLSRASEALRLILELNPAVQGHAVDESPDKLLRENPEFFKVFDVVVATSLKETTIKDLSDHLWELNIPFVLCRSVGFLGAFRIQIKEHAVIETHPDNEHPDLRLDLPFPALLRYFNQFELEKLDLKDHAHIPWPIILYKALHKWKSENNRWPQSRKDKDQIKEIIKESIRKDENDIPIDEENFEEALRAVNTAISPTFIPPNIKQLFHNTNTINLHRNSSPFWIMCAAVKSFVESEGNGCLPLRGTMPDMTASTEHYITLQNIYRTKAATDSEVVCRKVQQIVSELQCESISESDVKLFCRNCDKLYFIQGSCISQEYQPGGPISSYISKYLEEPDVMMVNYILLRAAEKFESEHCRYPGDWEAESDITELKNCVAKILTDYSCQPFPKDDHVHEMCRYGGAEIHSVSSFLGGCVAHELIKLITKQYKLVDNFFIHDAASTNSTVFTF